MILTPNGSAPCSLYLITPILSGNDAGAFAGAFAEVVQSTAIACALVRLAPAAHADAKAIIAPLLGAAIEAGCALLIEDDPRLAVRLGADGAHINCAGAELADAIERLKPDRIVGAGSLRTRDEAMTAGEMGADYVMFGEKRRGGPSFESQSLPERVRWWAEIFETPCVAYAESIAAAGALADAGADFIALCESVWECPSPANAVREVQSLLAGQGANVR